MIDFEGTPPFLRITLFVSMDTMQFHIAQTVCFCDEFVFPHKGSN